MGLRHGALISCLARPNGVFDRSDSASHRAGRSLFGTPRREHSYAAWRRHHEECQRLPEGLYHRDRFCAISGRVTDEEGKPIREALVRCVKLESLLELAKAGTPSPTTWAVPIEAGTTTNDEGTYEFPHLPVRARTFFYSAPGQALGQAVKDLVVVQDGLGAQLDVTLMRPLRCGCG